jgi:four helix bundle suffix protein
MAGSGRIILPHGSYKRLHSYRKTEIIYDLTVRFCQRFLSVRDRTVDQMVQAARSGKQNIVEGCMASGTSKETEIKLVNVARASLEELLEDYFDFLRTRNLTVWEKNSREALYVRKLSRESGVSYEAFREFVETRPAEVVANIAVCLINQATFLLERQLETLERQFLEEGGIRERMAKARLESRQRK